MSEEIPTLKNDEPILLSDFLEKAVSESPNHGRVLIAQTRLVGCSRMEATLYDRKVRELSLRYEIMFWLSPEGADIQGLCAVNWWRTISDSRSHEGDPR